jgi:LysM repeat protein
MLRKNLLYKFGLTFTLLLIAFSGIGAAAAPQQSNNIKPVSLPANCTQYYVVKRGDYLVKIARMFNTTWQYLAQINHL